MEGKKMFFIIFLGLLCLNLFVHELAHGLRMKHYGIEVSEVGLGIPIPHFPCLTINISPTLKVKIHLFFIGAYVRVPGEKKIESLPYFQKAHIYGAGVIANLMVFLVLFGLAFVWEIIIHPLAVFWKLGIPLTVFVLCVFLGFLLWKGSRIISAYVFPLLGILLTWFLIWSIKTSGLKESIAGPIRIIQMGMGISKVSELLLAGLLVSLGIATINLLPLLPLDGGKILYAFITMIFGENRLIKQAFIISSFLAFCLLIVMVISVDISRLLAPIRQN